jgi:hypothetical protein
MSTQRWLASVVAIGGSAALVAGVPAQAAEHAGENAIELRID